MSTKLSGSRAQADGATGKPRRTTKAAKASPTQRVDAPGKPGRRTKADTRDTGRLRTLRARLPKAAELLAHELLSDITARELGPGDRLPQEAVMIERYGVARATVREALRILEVNGLIEIRSGPRGGPILRDAGPADFSRMASFFLQAEGITVGEILEARVQLEPFLARGACRRRDKTFLARVADLKAQSLAVDLTDSDAYLRVTRGFHELIGAASTNRMLSLLSQCLMALFAVRFPEDVFPLSDRVHVIREHDEVMALILAGDADAAEQIMTEHMVRFARRVKTARPDQYEKVLGR